MNEEEFGARTVRSLLDNSSARIDPSARARLREARERAMSRYDAHSTESAFAWAGNLIGAGGGGNFRRNHYFYWLAAMLFAITLATSIYWKHTTDQDANDVDIAILTDDLPIEMYVD